MKRKTADRPGIWVSLPWLKLQDRLFHFPVGKDIVKDPGGQDCGKRESLIQHVFKKTRVLFEHF